MDQFTDEQKVVLNHVNDLGRKMDNAAFNLDQLKIGREAFVNRLIALVEKPVEEAAE